MVLPGPTFRWRFQVAQSREAIDGQIRDLRSTWSKLRRARARPAGAGGLAGDLRPVAAPPGAARSRRHPRRRPDRIAEHFPREVEPLVDEINELLAHSEAQAEEARRHAGNLAHALKTPLTVITNAATAHSPDLNDTVIREASVMRRQVDHHLARARAIGRRASAQARATVWESAEAVERAVRRSIRTSPSTSSADKDPQVGSSGRTSTRCSAIWSRMPRNMAMGGCS